MTKDEKQKFIAHDKRLRLQRRTFLFIDSIGFRHWSKADLLTFLDRLTFIVGDDITGPDLSVLVRLYNRELKGRKHAALHRS